MRGLISVLFVVFIVGCSDPHQQQTTNSSANASLINTDGLNASPNYVMEFPQDHLAHPGFDIEWWYLTSNLQDANGNDFSLQWTLFRFRQNSGANSWIDDQIYMGHASLHSENEHWFNEKFAGNLLGNAGVSDAPLHYFIDTWKLSAQDKNTLFPASLQADINTLESSVSITLDLSATGPLILHGEKGFSRKTADASHASHYYSQPFLDASGEILIDGKRYIVNGTGWFDHEWSSQLVANETLGWDWFSIHLDDGNKLMLFRMRVGEEQFITGSFINDKGKVTTLAQDDIALSIIENSVSQQRKYPSRWNIEIEKFDLDLVVTAVKQDAFNPSIFSYYEGATKITGSHTGVGFLELTGY